MVLGEGNVTAVVEEAAMAAAEEENDGQGRWQLCSVF